MSKKTQLENIFAQRILEHGNAQKIGELCLDEIIFSSFNAKLNEQIEKCKNVVHLSVAMCGLRELKDFPKLRKLRYLDLQNNSFTDQNLKDLTRQIQSLDGLNVSKNCIKNIDTLIDVVNKLSIRELNIFETPLLENFPKSIQKLFESCKTLQCIDWEDKKGKQVNQYDQQQSSSDGQNQQSQKQYSEDQQNEESYSCQSSKKVKVE